MSLLRASEALDAASRRIGRLDAEVLAAHLLGVDRGRLLLDRDMRIDTQAYELLVDRRADGEPVAYITGRREFWSLDLWVTPDVLIPRPDSETLIEAALAWVSRPPSTILDLGTGSGALLLAALSEWSGAVGVGVDISEAALAVAAGNATRLGLAGRVAFRVGDWDRGLGSRFDLVLCNPPYVEVDAELSVDVRAYEPAMALFAGADGLDAYRRLLPGLPGLLTPDGVAVVEIGSGQARAVLGLAGTVGLAGSVRRDLAGLDRCVVLRAQRA